MQRLWEGQPRVSGEVLFALPRSLLSPAKKRLIMFFNDVEPLLLRFCGADIGS